MSRNDVTVLLENLGEQPGIADELLPIVYHELRELAAKRLQQEKAGQTLQATALVHEAFVRLVDVEHQQHWQSRKHFFAAAAEAMRRILVENARRKKSLKRGGEFDRADLEVSLIAEDSVEVDLLALDEALEALELHDAQAATIVKLKFFSNLTMAECAKALDLSQRSAERLWTYARTWLFEQLSES
ncbi:MAG: ECF-type sigma factor [Planctomycetota bacterium]